VSELGSSRLLEEQAPASASRHVISHTQLTRLIVSRLFFMELRPDSMHRADLRRADLSLLGAEPNGE